MKTYQRLATLTEVVIDYERNLVTGINDFRTKVVMTIKQSESMYKEVV